MYRVKLSKQPIIILRMINQPNPIRFTEHETWKAAKKKEKKKTMKL
jgi:hypothetical protein